MDIRPINDEYSVSGQITVEELDEIKAIGANAVAGLSAAAIGGLSSAQAGALTTQQLKVMNDAQVEAVIKAYKTV